MSEGYNEAMLTMFEEARILLDHFEEQYESRPRVEVDGWLSKLAEEATGLSHEQGLDFPVGRFNRVQIEYAVELARRSD